MRSILFLSIICFFSVNVFAANAEYLSVFKNKKSSSENFSSAELKILSKANDLILDISHSDRKAIVGLNLQGHVASLVNCNAIDIYYIVGVEFEGCMAMEFSPNSKKVVIQNYSAVRFIAAFGAGLSASNSVDHMGGNIPDDMGDSSAFVSAVFIGGVTAKTGPQGAYGSLGVLNIGVGLKIGNSKKDGPEIKAEIIEEIYEDFFEI